MLQLLLVAAEHVIQAHRRRRADWRCLRRLCRCRRRVWRRYRRWWRCRWRGWRQLPRHVKMRREGRPHGSAFGRGDFKRWALVLVPRVLRVWPSTAAAAPAAIARAGGDPGAGLARGGGGLLACRRLPATAPQWCRQRSVRLLLPLRRTSPRRLVRRPHRLTCGAERADGAAAPYGRWDFAREAEAHAPAAREAVIALDAHLAAACTRMWAANAYH